MMLAQIGQPFLGFIIGSFAATWILLAVLFIHQRKELAALREALKGTDGSRLEPLLTDHLRSKLRLEEEYQGCVKRITELEGWARKAVSRAGFVRYDAFEDIGGKQSFALALCSELGDGIVITGITGRDQVRVYSKSLVGGKSESGLTPEELEAIRLAGRSGRQA
jgi:hypothetical protein